MRLSKTIQKCLFCGIFNHNFSQNQDDVEKDESKVNIGDVQVKLKSERCKYIEEDVNDIDDLMKQRTLSEYFNKFKAKMKNNKNYPHSKRYFLFYPLPKNIFVNNIFIQI